MSPDIKIAIDAEDPHMLNRFWVERIIGLGATHLWDGQQGPQQWVTLADPEGNEFCVA